MAFIDRIRPAPLNGGFAMDEYWVWCGSVTRGDDDRYHMFAARWPKSLPFFAGYQTHSEIVRAVSDTPEGPYLFQEQVLPARGAEFWDGRMTHNPTIHKLGDTYLLFYIGGTYDGPSPGGEVLRQGTTAQPRECYASICIGLATAPSVLGPWTRPDEPVLRPRPNKWDGTIVTNPAPCVLPDGRILLYYRANTPHGLRIGATRAEGLGAPFERISDDPVLIFEGDNNVEDPYVWWAGDHLELVAKDMTGGITGEKHAGVHATSPDGLQWTLADPPKAYSRRVVWENGPVTVQGSLERPQLLFHDDDAGVARPTHLFCATGDGPGGFRSATRTWNMVLPLGVTASTPAPGSA